MGCCGRNNRSATTRTATPSPRSTSSASSSSSFQYIGGSGLTVQGPVSKRLYRFAGPGAIVTVDARDAASLTRVPLLRRV